MFSHLPVRGKIVFITIDDGWEKDPAFVRLIRERHVPVTLFLTDLAIRKDYGYFRGLQRAGALIEDHTMTHPYLPRLSYERQREQICTSADIYARQYGSRPTLFRAPYGATGRDTLRAARDCGMKAVFFWREVVTGGRIAYQTAGRLHPGGHSARALQPEHDGRFQAPAAHHRRTGVQAGRHQEAPARALFPPVTSPLPRTAATKNGRKA